MKWVWLTALIIGFSESSECSEFSEFSESSEFSEISESSENPYSLSRTHDSLYYLNEFRLPYPVYRFCTGDVNGDGSPDALVGVVKRTRFHHEMGRRIFIFKQVDGKVRPLWMGSKLGGILQDFRVVEDESPKPHKPHKPHKTHKTHKTHKPHTPCTIRALETTADGRYVVSEYRWEGFGLAFDRFLIKNTDKETAYKYFNL